MASGGSIFIDLILRDAQYVQGTKRAKSATSDFESGIKSLARSIAPLLGGAGFLAIANNALESADAIQKSAKALGLSVENFQKFSFAAKLGGIDSETFTNAIIKLNNNLAAGKLPYATTQSAILGIADKLKNAKDGIEKTRIASEAFGAKLGAKLIPALGEGSASLIKMGQDAEKLGLVFDSKLTKQSEAFKDEIETLGLVFTKNFQAGLLEGFVGDSKKIKDIYSDPAFLESVKALGEAFGAVAKAALALAVVPGYLRAIFVELPSKAGEGIGNFIKNGSVASPNPNVPSTPPIFGGVQHNSAAIDQALINHGLQSTVDLLERQKELEADIATQAAEHAKQVAGVTDSIDKQTALLKVENDHWGESKNAIDEIVALKQIELDAAAKGLDLSAADLDNIKKKLDALKTEKDLKDDLAEVDKAAADAAKKLADEQKQQQQLLQESIEHIKEDLTDNLYDAVTGAKSLSQAFKDVAGSIVEAITKAQILKLLSGGQSGGGDLLGALFGGSGGSSFFDSIFPSYDVGTPFVPQDQMAQLHKGEMVIPKVQADAIRKGQAGNNIVMNITTQDSGSFLRSQSQILAQTQQMLARAQRRNN